MFNFKIISKDKKSKARAGEIHTYHGIVKTPAFVAVGTRASVRGLTPLDLKQVGTEILFGNTYHLHLRPGEEVVQEFGGLGKFMGWDGVTMTDSGGFQVFSLGQKLVKLSDADDTEIKIVKIKEDGVTFRSHLDGSEHVFTPEESIRIQKKLGADIILAFDECAPYPSTYKYTKEAMERTHDWAVRSLSAHKFELRNSKSHRDLGSETKSNIQNSKYKNDSNFGYYSWKQALYGIVQGGVYEDLRLESAKFIAGLTFDGIAIGGVSVGESKKEMRDALAWTIPYLPESKPRHLLGIGEIDDIFDAIEKGIDTFDCVIPTRLGRYGLIFTTPPEGNSKNKFMIDIKKTVFAKGQRPIFKGCLCYVCKNFSRGYINHLFRSQELLAYRLASYHNLYFINDLVGKIRESILEGRFGEMKRKWLSNA